MNNSILSEVLMTAVTGVLVVFIGLVLLILVISLMRLFSGEEKKPRQKAAQKAAAPAKSPAPKIQETPAPVEDGQLVAVLSAAVAAIWQETEPQTGFVVRRIRRIRQR